LASLHGFVDTKIPNIVHFIYGLKGPGEPLFYFHYLAVLSAIRVNRPDAVYFHYQYPPEGQWWDEIQQLVVPVQRNARESIGTQRLSHYAHRCDVMRLEILLEQGGVYLDIDTLCIQPWRDLLDHSFVIGEELPYGRPVASLCNAVMLSEIGAGFVKAWLEHYPSSFKEGEWTTTSCVLPRLLSQTPELGPRITILPVEKLHHPTGPELFNPGEIPRDLMIAHYWGHLPLCDQIVRSSSPAMIRQAPDVMFSKIALQVFDGSLPGE
jgi:hypothetical protein